MIITTILDKRYGVPPAEPCQAGETLGSPRKKHPLDTGTSREGLSDGSRREPVSKANGKRKISEVKERDISIN